MLLLDDKSAPEGDLQLHSLAHGVIALQHVAQDYGAERRRLQVTKLRGLRFQGGFHDFRICTGGLAVFPRLRVGTQTPDARRLLVPSGSAALDQLMGGGLRAGTSLLVTGPAGTGKSVLATQYACAAADVASACASTFRRAMSTFDCAARGWGSTSRTPSTRPLRLQVEPTQYSPRVRARVMRAVDEDGVRLIVIDPSTATCSPCPRSGCSPSRCTSAQLPGQPGDSPAS